MLEDHALDQKMVELHRRDIIEISVGPLGELWINVDGKCLLRAKDTRHLVLDLPKEMPPNMIRR